MTNPTPEQAVIDALEAWEQKNSYATQKDLRSAMSQNLGIPDGGGPTSILWLEVVSEARAIALTAERQRVEVMRKALEARDKAAGQCPVNHPERFPLKELGGKECSKCGATTAGPCWTALHADSTFIKIARTALGETK